MKALYYLAAQERLDRFQTLFDEEDVFASPFAAETLPSLTAFVMKDRAIAQQDYVLVDVGTMERWSSAHILSAVQYLRRFSRAKPVFIGTKSDAVTELFGALASVHHIDALIEERTGTDVEQELREILRDTPRFPEKLQAIQSMVAQSGARAAAPLSVPAGLVLHIAVAGTMSRCGTTSQSFALWHYLKSIGLKPVIWDRFARMLPQIMALEPSTQLEDGAVSIHGVTLCDRLLPERSVYIIDHGVLNAENAAAFCDADLCILVGCTKPWELPAFAEAMKLLIPFRCPHLVTLASFSTPRDLEALKKYLGGRSGLAPYHVDLWQAPPDMKVYTDLVLPQMKDLCATPRIPEQDLEAER